MRPVAPRLALASPAGAPEVSFTLFHFDFMPALLVMDAVCWHSRQYCALLVCLICNIWQIISAAAHRSQHSEGSKGLALSSAQHRETSREHVLI